MDNKGLIIKPYPEKGIECYIDAEYSKVWNQDEGTEPVLVLSRTGYVTMYASCPIIWVSLIQTGIALITIEA